MEDIFSLLLHNIHYNMVCSLFLSICDGVEGVFFIQIPRDLKDFPGHVILVMLNER